MPSVWNKIKEYWTWFLCGKIPYSQLSDEKKQEARRDVYFRLFIIANAPYVGTVYTTFLMSMTPAMALFDILMKVVPEGDLWKKRIGRFSFGMYATLHIVTMSVGMVYIVIPCYKFIFNSIFYFFMPNNIWNFFQLII